MGFRIGWDVICFVGKHIFYCVIGLIQIIFYLQVQRFFTLLLIVLLVIGDIYFIAPGCKKFSESCLHIMVLLSPFIYLSITGKKGVIQQ